MSDHFFGCKLITCQVEKWQHQHNIGWEVAAWSRIVKTARWRNQENEAADIWTFETQGKWLITRECYLVQSWCLKSVAVLWLYIVLSQGYISIDPTSAAKSAGTFILQSWITDKNSVLELDCSVTVWVEMFYSELFNIIRIMQFLIVHGSVIHHNTDIFFRIYLCPVRLQHIVV